MKASSYELSERKILLHFVNPATEEILKLEYQIYNHSLIERWWSLLERSLFNQGIFGAVSITGQILDDEELVVTTLNYLILKINTYVESKGYLDLIIPHTVERSVPQKILNELHRYFEIHSADKRIALDLNNSFRLLNLFIHRMENFSDGKKNNCVIIEITPATWKFLPLEGADFNLFSPDWVWGELTLNYCLVGIPTMQAFLNDSEPRPQNCFSSGMYLSFVENKKFDQYTELDQWLIKKDLPINDPRTAIGYIPLGLMTKPQIPTTEEERVHFLLEFKKFTTLKKIEYKGLPSKTHATPLDLVPKGHFDV